MSDHTPGPWFPATGWVGKGDLQHPQVICRVENFPYGTTEANLCLIAAAPELLEACKAIVELLDDRILVRNTSHDHEVDWAIKQIAIVQKLAKLPEAIAKAEGKP